MQKYNHGDSNYQPLAKSDMSELHKITKECIRQLPGARKMLESMITTGTCFIIITNTPL